MSQTDARSPLKDAEISMAFARRMMQNALVHLVGAGLEPHHAFGFKKHGLFGDIVPPSMVPDIASILLDAAHVVRIPLPDGPLVITRDGNARTVVEVDSLLLSPDQETRRSACAFFRQGCSAHPPWVTGHTAALLSERSSEVESQAAEAWQDAGMLLIPALRQDLFVDFAGLRQSLAARYDDGLNKYLPQVMRPAFDTLARFRPPLWSPLEQRDELTGWIAECAAQPTLVTALSQYMDRCGYVPLSAEYGAGEVLRQWSALNPNERLTWDSLWSWAVNAGSPLAKYHAITAALHVSSLRPLGAMDQLWEQVAHIVGVGDPDGSSPDNIEWRIYCELASHFARHVESVHPGQHGERVACYAWWLAVQVAPILGTSGRRAKNTLKTIVIPEGRLSFSRWLVARSPVVPTALRYITLYSSSVWAVSLLAQLGQSIESLEVQAIPSDSRETISRFLKGYLITSPLADRWDSSSPILALGDNAKVSNLTASLLDAEERDAFLDCIRERARMLEHGELHTRLETLHESSAQEQHLRLQFLKDIVYSTDKADAAITEWLNQTGRVVETLQGRS